MFENPTVDPDAVYHEASDQRITTLGDHGFLFFAVVRDPATVIVLRLVTGLGERQATTALMNKIDTFASRSVTGRADGRVGTTWAESESGPRLSYLLTPGRSFCSSCPCGVLVTQEGGSDVVSTVMTEEACTGFALPQWLRVPLLVVAPAAPVVTLATDAGVRR